MPSFGMRKKHENPRPEQPSSVAVVVMGHQSWIFHPQMKSWTGSIGYRSKEQAIKAALAAGFRTVKCDGKIVAQIKKEEPKEATDGQQEEVIEEDTQEADPRASERTGV